MSRALTELGSAIARARSRRGWSQATLSAEAGVSEPLLSGIEKGRRVPSLPVLVRLFDKLDGSGDEREREDGLAQWLASRVVAEASHPTSSRLEHLDSGLHDLLLASANRLSGAVRRRTRPPVPSTWSLAEFASLGPFIAICGDRREPRPRSLADLFILSGAISDITWLPRAPEGSIAAVRTDKLVVQLSNAALTEQFGGHNLLVIAGPNANWAARFLNPTALWRTAVEPPWEDWDREFRAHAELNQRSVLAAFSSIINASPIGPQRRGLSVDEAALTARYGQGAVKRARALTEKLLRGPDGLHTPDEIIKKFQTGRFVDPIEHVMHDVSLETDVNLAAVSLAPHPWAREEGFVAVIVAGTGGPGTTEALRVLLEEPRAFEERPFGGVLEVQLPDQEDWSSRFRKPTWNWVTSPYDPRDLTERLDNQAARDLVERLIHHRDAGAGPAGLRGAPAERGARGTGVRAGR